MADKIQHSFDAVIFDMDGLVLDTEPGYFQAWQAAASQMGLELPGSSEALLRGLQYKDVHAYLSAQFGEDFDFGYFNTLSGEIWRSRVSEQGIPVQPGLTGLLQKLNELNIPFCLASNSQASNIEECLRLADLSSDFEHIFSQDQVQSGKPAPDIFILAADQLACSIQNCLILEDSAIGIEAAIKADAISVYIPGSQNLDLNIQEIADYSFQNLAQFEENI